MAGKEVEAEERREDAQVVNAFGNDLSDDPGLSGVRVLRLEKTVCERESCRDDALVELSLGAVDAGTDDRVELLVRLNDLLPRRDGKTFEKPPDRSGELASLFDAISGSVKVRRRREE